MTESARRALFRRSMIVVVVSQIFGGAGLAAGVTVGGLLAQDMLGGEGVAGLPSALFTLGSALAAYTVGHVSQRAGRRPGLTAGFAAGSLGAAGIVVAAVAGSPPLLFLAMFVYGSGTATNLQARYAGTDLAPPGGRATAASIALVSTTAGAVGGPLSVNLLGDVAIGFGLPALTGPFLLAAVAYGLAGLVMYLFLRPDPLLVARHDAAQEGADAGARAARASADAGVPAARASADAGVPAARADTGEGGAAPGAGPSAADAVGSGAGSGSGSGGRAPGANAGVAAGATVMVLTQIAMVAIMTMTPVHMRHHHHDLGQVGFVISMHIAAMFLPSPITGRLVDRFGCRPMAVAAAVTLLAAGVVAAAAPGDSTAALTVALVLLGLGWNFGLISGTTYIVESTEPATRARTQGTVDVLIAISGAGGGAISGVVVGAAGYATLSLGGGLLALLLIPALIRQRRAEERTRGESGPGERTRGESGPGKSGSGERIRGESGPGKSGRRESGRRENDADERGPEESAAEPSGSRAGRSAS